MISDEKNKKVHQWISIRPRRIYNTKEEHESRANEFKNYLLACAYKPSNKPLIWTKAVNLLSLVIAIHILYTRSCQSVNENLIDILIAVSCK